MIPTRRPKATAPRLAGRATAGGDVSRRSGSGVAGARRSIVAGEVGRSQDHLAEPPVRRLTDPVGSTLDSRSSRTISMTLSLPAKTGCRMKVSTRSMIVDSSGMTIPPVINNDVDCSDVPSIAFASCIPKQPLEPDRDAAARVPPRGRLAAVRSRRGARDENEGPGPLGTRLVRAHPTRRAHFGDVVVARASRPCPGRASRAGSPCHYQDAASCPT